MHLASITDNVSYTGTLATAFTTRTINSLRTWNYNVILPMASDSATLTLASGGLLAANNNNQWITGGKVTSSYGTSSVAELFTWVNQDIAHITSKIVDNGAQALTLYKSGPGSLGLSAVNTYTGGTVVNQGTLLLEGTGQTLNTGNLTINGGTVTESTVSGQIPSTTVVTMNGGLLNLLGNHTLPGLTLNTKGGNVSPVVTSTSVGNGPNTLTLTGNLTANIADPMGVASTISGNLALSGGGTKIVVNGTSFGLNPVGLAINGVIASTPAGGLVKDGDGVLALGAANTYEGGTTINGGRVAMNNADALSNGTVTLGSSSELYIGGAQAGLLGRFYYGTGGGQFNPAGAPLLTYYVADKLARTTCATQMSTAGLNTDFNFPGATAPNPGSLLPAAVTTSQNPAGGG